MAEEWLYLINKKTGERCAVRPEHYAAKVADGFRLDPDVGGQDAPKVAKPSDSDPTGRDATKPAE